MVQYFTYLRCKQQNYTKQAQVIWGVQQYN